MPARHWTLGAALPTFVQEAPTVYEVFPEATSTDSTRGDP
jgi:hypothetical protein